MTHAQALLAELKAAAEKATPSKWEIDSAGDLWVSANEGQTPICMITGLRKHSPRDKADAAYIVAAQPSTILALTAYVEAQQERIAELEKGLEPFAALSEIFEHEGGNRPREGVIAAWSDHRVGERELTVDMLRRARKLIGARP